YYGPASFIQSGGTHLVTSSAFLGFYNSGTYTLSGGDHTIGTPGSKQVFYVGNFSSGYGGNGQYSLSNTGCLTINGREVIGFQPGIFGSFTQSGGTHVITDILDVGSSGNGSYDFSAGVGIVGSEAVPGELNVGHYGGSIGVF